MYLDGIFWKLSSVWPGKQLNWKCALCIYRIFLFFFFHCSDSDSMLPPLSLIYIHSVSLDNFVIDFFSLHQYIFKFLICITLYLDSLSISAHLDFLSFLSNLVSDHLSFPFHIPASMYPLFVFICVSSDFPSFYQ